MGKYSSVRKKDPLTGTWYWDTPLQRVRNLSLHEYLVSRTTVCLDTGCWEWITKAKKSKSTATHTSLPRGKDSVGRAAWYCFFGEIPPGLDVCHECDNGHCANPMHLFLGTRLENMQDCVSKGRHVHGTRHYRAKLSEEDVLQMKRSREEGRTYQSIADFHGITLATCWTAINGKSWKHLK